MGKIILKEEFIQREKGRVVKSTGRYDVNKHAKKSVVVVPVIVFIDPLFISIPHGHIK
jgi:hypothetical protein